MANTKTTKEVATKEVKKVAPKAKESKTMKQEVKEVAVKEVATKAVEVKEVKNEDKVNFISIQEATQLYAEAGIKCKNPQAKGNYRIMGGGSSLNIKPKKGYYIYTSNDDFANISSSGIEAKDLVIEEGTNAQDKTRPNTIICSTLETLKELLALYAQNPFNKVATEAESK